MGLLESLKKIIQLNQTIRNILSYESNEITSNISIFANIIADSKNNIFEIDIWTLKNFSLIKNKLV